MKESSFVYLKDYKPYPFKIPKIELNFYVDKDTVLVTMRMKVVPISTDQKPFVLKGVGIKLSSIEINGKEISNNEYILTKEDLTIKAPKESSFDIKITSEVNPFKNTSLEGLYSSHGILTTQCEAEGFRRICFHPDRPDILSQYKVRIEATREDYPVLLSNGNKVSSGLIKGDPQRHYSIWDDPHPKPSYLFAIVAGKLNEVKSNFTTSSGKAVLLKIFVEEGDDIYTQHALNSLKRAMEWDQSVYGLEYDLNEYNIVAIRHFNMGAMENKGLNIFNSKLVLADSEIATDTELERIESVVAHEYFHNWTGNRVTLRDWFQLSLKEGLTVFRDQSFTSDLHSYAVKRVEDVSLLRNTQFREDAGPTSHAVKPSRYKSIDNFYTTTIYEKGAEIIRMLEILMGRKKFIKGIKNYIEKFDGSAATTENFVQAIVEDSQTIKTSLKFDIAQFNQWYYQAGTPKVEIKTKWDAIKGNLKLNFKQHTKNCDQQSKNKPLVIPILISLIDEEGCIREEETYILNQIEQSLTFENLPRREEAPSISIFRKFSAPVKWTIDLSDKDAFRLLTQDDDPFSRWEAGQVIMRKALIARASKKPDLHLEEKFISKVKDLIENEIHKDPSFLVKLLTMPGLSELEESQKNADPLALYEAKKSFKKILGKMLCDTLKLQLKINRPACISKWPNGQGERKFVGLIWSWLASIGEQEILKEALEAVKGSSMTLSRAALDALQQVDCLERELAMDIFYARWKEHPIVLDTWFALKAGIPSKNGLSLIKELLEHPKYDSKAPNSVRAVLGGLAKNTPIFHALDGSGYEFMAEQILKVDQQNPITASRIAKVFSHWKSYSSPHKERMKASIDLLYQKNLSINTSEVLTQIIK